MNSHPEDTSELLSLAPLPPDAYTLDLGAGDGSSGCSVCVDISPRSDNVLRADMLSLPFPDATFDAVISQCAFYCSGNPAQAFSEAMRVLRPGGILLLSDVFFSEPFPGYEAVKDITPRWREYYLRMLWQEDNVPVIKKAARYYLLAYRKKE